MIVLRSDPEIATLRKAGRIVAAVLEKLAHRLCPDMMTSELDTIASEEIAARGGLPAFKGYRGFPANICVSVNETVVHGIPSKRLLKEGDIVSIDVGVKLDGYFADGAMTAGVGKISREAARLIEVTEESLYRGIKMARSGNRLSEVSAAVQDCVETEGFSAVRVFVGHGIGTSIHEEPEIPNFRCGKEGPVLEPGMILAIEPMINAGSHEVEILPDGWTAVTKDRKLSAHFEHSVAVTRGDPLILTEK